MGVRASVKMGEVRKMRDKLARNIRFGVAASLSKAAEETSESIKDGLRHFFTIRNQYTAGGIRWTRASIDKPVAIVGAIEPAPAKGKAYLDKHALGGKRDVKHKTKVMSGISVDVGSGIPIGARPQKRVWTKKSIWPGPIYKRDGTGSKSTRRWVGGSLQNVQIPRKTNRTFVTQFGGKKFLVTRISRGKKGKLKFWYFFSERRVPRIKKDWPFEMYQKVALQHLQRVFAAMMARNL